MTVKLYRDRLHAPCVPHDVLRELGLPPSRYGSWRLTPEQQRQARVILGLEPGPAQALPNPAASEPSSSRSGLFQHQREALTFLREKGGVAAIFHEMGLGKSRTIIEHLGTALTPHTLIVCPLSVAYTWQAEFEKWAGVQAEVIVGTLEQRLRMLDRPGPWVVNYDGLRIKRKDGTRTVRGRQVPKWNYPIVAKILSRNPQAVILDESTRIKNTRAETTKVVHKMVEGIPNRVILSGLPNPNAPHELWSQLRVLERAPLGFRSVYGMRDTYCVMGGFGGYQVLAHKNLEDLYHRLGKVAHRRKLRDCRDLPKLIHQTVPLALEPKEQKAYASMKKEAWAQISRAETLTAENVLAQLLRLQQITGGYAAAPRSKGTKVQAVLDLVSDAPTPVIIWCQFKEEIRTLAKVLGKAYKVRTLFGETTPHARKQLLTDFDGGCVDVLIGHPQAGGMGLNLQRASYMIFYSNGFSLEQRAQAIARIERTGQGNVMRVVDLVAKGTVDEKILKALEAKQKVSQVVLDGAEEWFK